jgi:pimeloyl-ACP methyl ester carboxylesterase
VARTNLSGPEPPRGVSGPARPSIILIHGAANSALVWRFWQQQLDSLGWSSHAIDLRGHGSVAVADLARVSMHDYAADVCGFAAQLRRPPIVLGWSMGGLVAMMVAARSEACACVCLAPSTPARRLDRSVPLRAGVFGPEEYGITGRNPADQPAMPDLGAEERAVALSALRPESRLARDERKRGIVIHSLPCPLLIVTGTRDVAWPRAKYPACTWRRSISASRALLTGVWS